MMPAEVAMSVKEVTVGTDYTDVPGGRFDKYGPFSGENFRRTVLVPALRAFDKVIVHLDGTKTYMSSFLEEAFGGLVRVEKLSYADLSKRLVVDSKDPKYAIFVRMVEQDMKAASAEAASGRRIVA
jgi:STAS-like domain of unknown function (DUF4325)